MRRHITTAALIAPLMGVGTLAAQDTTQNQNRDQYQQPPQQTVEVQASTQVSDTAIVAKLHASNQREVRLGQLAQRNGQSAGVKRFASQLVRDHQQADRKVTDIARQLGMTLMDHNQAHGQNRMGDANRQPGDTMNRGQQRDTTFRPGQPRDTTWQQDPQRQDTMSRQGQTPRDTTGWQGQNKDQQKQQQMQDEQQLQSLRGAQFDTAFARFMFQAHDRNIKMLEQAQHQIQNSELRSLVASTLTTMRQHRQTAQSLMNTATTTSSN